MVFKPMLSGTLDDVSHVVFPVMLSPKLDGIRCIIRNGVAVSRNLKPIPNKYIQAMLQSLPDGLDGELIVGPPNAPDVWNKTSSGVMSEDGTPDFKFFVFDLIDAETAAWGFNKRWNTARGAIVDHEFCKLVEHRVIRDAGALDNAEEYFVSTGYEGVMLRDPDGKYKFGRSTLRERGLLKMKRWFDAEATIVGFVERMHNENEAIVDELGRTKRSSHKANKTGRGDLGALVCVGPNEAEFEIGTGFSDADRQHIWDNQSSFVGKRVTFKYQQLSQDGVPRFPVFMRFAYDKERV